MKHIILISLILLGVNAHAAWIIQETRKGTFKINTETGQAIKYVCFRSENDMSSINYGKCLKWGWENEMQAKKISLPPGFFDDVAEAKKLKDAANRK